ncbi:hypothetical protein [Aggregatibacter actinomycetemcomitans]|uniref:hypothetical protein n=1 Tax=Aggregatibacter actinomycetemcomitans TaxID=714 RepID=UPI00197C36C3|nr:hypothetical protein [Aggregatibacter actinomycetemcomitans]
MMKQKILLLWIVLSQVINVFANIRDPHEGRICHVEAEYFYPGVWENMVKMN